MAGHSLPLAVLLVDVGRWGWEVPRLQPDGARTKTALQMAARFFQSTDHVQLMTSRYPPDLLDPVLDDLRGGQVLSADSVYRICDLLRSSSLKWIRHSEILQCAKQSLLLATEPGFPPTVEDVSP
jgi:hypothetical protein